MIAANGMNVGHYERESRVLIGFACSDAASGLLLGAGLAGWEKQAVQNGTGQGANAFPQIRTTQNCFVRIKFGVAGGTGRRVDESCLNPLRHNIPWAASVSGA